jgi:hypothetical protein
LGRPPLELRDVDADCYSVLFLPNKLHHIGAWHAARASLLMVDWSTFSSRATAH